MNPIPWRRSALLVLFAFRLLIRTLESSPHWSCCRTDSYWSALSSRMNKSKTPPLMLIDSSSSIGLCAIASTMEVPTLWTMSSTLPALGLAIKTSALHYNGTCILRNLQWGFIPSFQHQSLVFQTTLKRPRPNPPGAVPRDFGCVEGAWDLRTPGRMVSLSVGKDWEERLSDLKKDP